jgi:hypothetical protein
MFPSEPNVAKSAKDASPESLMQVPNAAKAASSDTMQRELTMTGDENVVA